LAIFAFASDREQEAMSVWHMSKLSPKILVTWAEQARQNGNYEKSGLWSERAIRVDSSLAEAWLQLGLAKLAANQVTAAVPALQEAWRLGSSDSANILATIMIDQGHHKQAQDIWSQALQNYPNARERIQWWIGLTSSFGALNRWEEAVELYREALREYPEHYGLLADYGWSLYQVSGDVTVASTYINRSIEFNSEPMLAYVRMGDLLAVTGQLEEAYTWYDEAAKHSTSAQVAILVKQADLAVVLERTHSAIELYRLAIKRSPGYAQAYFGLARAYRFNEEPQQAVAVIEEALNLMDPPILAYYMRASNIYEWAGNPEKARSVCEDALYRYPDNETLQNCVQRNSKE
jgi:tetratricopeptide (TPR) repeat protein